MFELRPYQKQARDAVLHEWAQGRRKTLLCLPTGTGKTVVFASVAKHEVDHGRRVMVLAHRGELLTQAADKLKNSAGLSSALEKAESSSLTSDAPVTVASVQTLARPDRLERFPPDRFGAVIVDEAHHVLSDSYQTVLNHFPCANILGVTATPDRGDKKSLGKYFDSLAFDYPIRTAIDDGYLCKIQAQMIPLQLDLNNVRLSEGDYAAGDVSNALEPYLARIADEMAKACQGRKTVVFLPLIRIAEELCTLLNRRGLKAAEVDGTSENREELLADFAAGRYDVLCNSMLLTEGWDCPAVDCVVVLRPTRMRGLYQQMVGRGLRPAPGKEYLLLLDFLWLTERHDLCKPASLLGLEDEVTERMNDSLDNGGDPQDLQALAEAAERDVVRERENSLAEVLSRMRNRKRTEVDPMQFAFSIAALDLVNYTPTFAWEADRPTHAQLELLERRGIATGAVTSKGMAASIIDELEKRRAAGLSTPKQIRLLEGYGFEHVGGWTFAKANNMISWLAENDWVLPTGFDPADFKDFSPAQYDA